MEEKVVKEVQSFFSSGKLRKSINVTHVKLIPKIQNPQKVKDYRSIALCNVYYNIYSKLLTSRLQPILPSIITENQTAFVPGRAITDDVLITHDILHTLKNSKPQRGAQW